jgi:hypothetical protein
MKLFKRNKFFHQDRIAMRIAARHGMNETFGALGKELGFKIY